MIQMRGRLLRRSRAGTTQQRLARLEAASRQQVLTHAHAIEVARSLETAVARAEENGRQLAEVRKLESAWRQQLHLYLHGTAIGDRIAAFEASWQQHIPAFLNAVASVSGFGYELSRTKRQVAEAGNDIRLQAEAIDKLQNSIAEIASRLHAEVKGLGDKAGAIEGEIGDLWSKIGAVDEKSLGFQNKFGEIGGQIVGLWNKVGAIDDEFRGSWKKFAAIDEEITGLRDSNIGITRVIEDLLDKDLENEPKTRDNGELHAGLRISNTTMNNENSRLSLHRDYRIRSAPVVFDDRKNKDEWQREVYEYAHQFAEAKGLKTIVDFGCGSAFKLLKHFSNYRTIGYEIGETLDYLKQTYPTKEWRDGQNLTIDVSDCDLIICSDVIEHVDDPTRLMDAFRCSKASFFAISTPALELFSAWGFSGRFGPPLNPAHRCEWTTAEFHCFVSKYLSVQDHRITNLRQATQMIIATRYEENTTSDKAGSC